MADEGICYAAVQIVIAEGARHVGLAILQSRNRSSRTDAKRLRLTLTEFQDTTQYSNLESALVRWQPTELSYPQGSMSELELKKVQVVCESLSITAEEQKKTTFVSKDATSDVCRLLGEENLARFGFLSACPLAMGSLACLISVKQLAADPENAGAAVIESAGLNDIMRLDAAAVSALNLLPPLKKASGAGMKFSSLLGVLSQGCWSKCGTRVLKRWILQPLMDITELRARQDMVQLFVSDPVLRDELKGLVKVPDMDSLASRLQRRSASLLDLIRLYNLVQMLPNLVDKLASYDGLYASVLKAKFTDPLTAVQAEFSKYADMVEQVIEDVGSPEPRINPRWDPELGELASELEAVEDAVAKHVREVESTWGSGLDVKCERDKVRGYVFRVKKAHDKEIRKIASVAVVGVLKDGVHFVTEGSHGLRALGRRLKDVESAYEEKQKSLVANAVDVARSYTPVLESTSSLISELDAFNALAHVATAAPVPYVRPEFSEGAGDIILTGARHPVMEFQDGMTFIPNDYRMARETARFHIITGPNMGGKSTYIRQLGTILVMAQMGSFVPCETATLSLIDSVLARVGAGDSQLKGVSTFMAEMLEASSILEMATNRSLVIVDELGRGTSTYDGFGLAWAISEHLATKTGCYCLFATHFHELTSLADSVPCMVNRHVTAHTTEDSITMLYSVEDGPCPSSFGIHVAELAAFPPSVVEEARQKASELEKLSLVGRELLNKSVSAVVRGGGDDAEAPSPTKRGKVAPASAEDQAVDKFLAEFAAVPLDSLPADEALRLVTALVDANAAVLARAVGLPA